MLLLYVLEPCFMGIFEPLIAEHFQRVPSGKDGLTKVSLHRQRKVLRCSRCQLGKIVNVALPKSLWFPYLDSESFTRRLTAPLRGL